MTTDKINQSLRERFAQPLRDCYSRRIIFWHDSEREFESILDELDIPGVKILRLTGDNFFYAKMLLSETDTESDYLVYDPIAYKQMSDNSLRDIEHYSEDFRADLVSIQMEELNIPQTTQLRRAMKHYAKFFENKDRAAKLSALGTRYENAGQLHIDIMAVLAGTRFNTVQGVIRALLCGGLYEEENRPLENIRKFGSEDALREMLARYIGYTADEISLYDIAAHLLMTALSSAINDSGFSGSKKYISETHQPFCYAAVDDWAHSDDSEKLIDIEEEVVERCGIYKILNDLDVEKLLDSGCLPCIDVCIISHYMKEISDDVIKSADIINAAEKRRTLGMYGKFSCFYDGLYQLAKMQEFYLEHIGGFHYGSYSHMWKAYCEELYLMDTYYRRFHIAFRKSLIDSSSELDDLFKNTADKAENLYKNWYLTELNRQWCTLIRDDAESFGRLNDLPQQTDFYENEALPVIHNKSRLFVIISDALRFEVAAELNERLIRETNGTAKISAMQSVMPSMTKYGMSALLPHEELTLTDDMTVLCDGIPTGSTEYRDTILKKYCPNNAAVTYKTLLSMKQAERRELAGGAEVVYIYHNTIDAVADKPSTEDQVFEACADAVEELKNLVKLIVNTMNGSNIIITSDHGFLYSYRALSESDKGDRSLIDGEILEFGRRSVIAKSGTASDHLMKIPMTRFASEHLVFSPYEIIRMKKQGGGMNFVHGGISLQECCVPVIAFKNIKAGSKNFVDIKKVELQLLSRTRKISNNIFSLDFFQKDAVCGKTVPAEYELYICGRSSKPVSDVQTVLADKTTDYPPDRVYRVRFTLKGQEFSGSEPYYLNIVEKDTGAVTDHIEFSIKIAFANDFDF